MRTHLRLPLLSLLFPLLAACGSPPARSTQAAALVLVARRIHTLAPDRPEAEAVLIRGGRIEAVGSRAEILRLAPADALVEEYPGYLYPGLTDSHAHLLSLGASLENVDLRGAPDPAAVVERAAARAAALPAGTWILGRGWDQTLWPGGEMPDHRALSARTPDHPVWLARVDGHAGLANARALALAGVGLETPDPPGGRILRLPDGSPSGVLVDNAMDLVAGKVPPAAPADVERRLLLAQEACLAAGLARIHDAWTDEGVRAALRRLEREGRWRLGVYGMHPAPAAGADPPPPDDPGPRARLRFRALKLFADGALGSRGAALLAPYDDEPGQAGLVTLPEAELRRLVRRCRELGLQPCVHAIGDRANRLVLDAYEQELDAAGRRELRPRIEHAQVLAPADIPRFAALGVVAAMQPTHLTSDMDWAPRRLGPSRTKGAYAFGTLLAAGARVPFGSDFPVERVSPLLGLFAAVTTRPPDNPEAPPFRPDQAVSPREALRGFTAEAAFAAFEEEVRGRIAPGCEADLTVLDTDLLAGPPARILGARVLAVYVAGEAAWRP